MNKERTKSTKKTRKDKDWVELCEYIKKEILNYDDNMRFPKALALRLRGLQYGQYIANNNIEREAKYDSYTLLCTFKLCRNRIVNYFINHQDMIKDERHKINIMMKIVESEVNDVYMRLQQVKQIQEQKERTSSSIPMNTPSASYTRKTKEITNEKLKKIF